MFDEESGYIKSSTAKMQRNNVKLSFYDVLFISYLKMSGFCFKQKNFLMKHLTEM